MLFMYNISNIFIFVFIFITCTSHMFLFYLILSTKLNEKCLLTYKIRLMVCLLIDVRMGDKLFPVSKNQYNKYMTPTMDVIRFHTLLQQENQHIRIVCTRHTHIFVCVYIIKRSSCIMEHHLHFYF